jgi:hypothetical protein
VCKNSGELLYSIIPKLFFEKSEVGNPDAGSDTVFSKMKNSPGKK